MATHELHVDVRIRLLGPVHVGSGSGRGPVTRAVLRDGAGRPVLPGSTLRGILRQSCEDLAESLSLPVSDPHGTSDIEAFVPAAQTPYLVDRLFGSRRSGGRLFVRDARWPEESFSPRYDMQAVSRVQIDRTLGTAAYQRLFQAERVLPPGTPFVTAISGFHDALTQYDGKFPVEYALLCAGIFGMERVGGQRSVGLGWIRAEPVAVRWNDRIIPGAQLESVLEEVLFAQWSELREWIDLLREESLDA